MDRESPLLASVVFELSLFLCVRGACGASSVSGGLPRTTAGLSLPLEVLAGGGCEREDPRLASSFATPVASAL
jgi:hypothetical protein